MVQEIGRGLAQIWPLALMAVLFTLIRGTARPESWSDQVSRERGWPTTPRRVDGPGTGTDVLGGLDSSGGDCGGSCGD